MQRRRAKLITGLVVLILATLALGATAITTINAEREHAAYESKLRHLSEKAAKLLPKEAFKPGHYSLHETHYVHGYRVTAYARVDDQGHLIYLEFDQLDAFGLFNPLTSASVELWNQQLLNNPNVNDLKRAGADPAFFSLYQKYMTRLIHAAHTGEVFKITVHNQASMRK
ncbi:hypothetical protein JCM31185_15180 [Furfurilactobacillus curtus]|uniref:DUF4825 domain-containing protein n=1 Tax=Furfurilactobacillus curtus TaxID=1746200 RepID=A0ABQ5JNT8_9LACO